MAAQPFPLEEVIMMANTAIGAAGNTRTITFKSQEHMDFYKEYLPKC